MPEEERKMLALLARIVWKINFGDQTTADEDRALSNILNELDAWDVDPKDFHW